MSSLTLGVLTFNLLRRINSNHYADLLSPSKGLFEAEGDIKKEQQQKGYDAGGQRDC